MQEDAKDADFYVFTLCDGDGQRQDCRVPRTAMSLGAGAVISKEMMDVGCKGLLYLSNRRNKARAGTASCFILPSVMRTEDAVELIQKETSFRPGWTVIPVCPDGDWNLLVGEHLGNEDEM